MSQLAFGICKRPVSEEEWRAHLRLARICDSYGVEVPLWDEHGGDHERGAELAVQQHPRLWVEFVRLTLRLAEKRDNGGAKRIAEAIRWHADIGDYGDEDFKLNNNHVAPLARAFARAYPKHADFFRFRGGHTLSVVTDSPTREGEA